MCKKITTEEFLVCKELLQKVLECEGKDVEQMISALIKTKKVFGEKIYHKAIEGIDFCIKEDIMELGGRATIYYALCGAIENFLGKELDIDFYYWLDGIDYFKKDFQFTHSQFKYFNLDKELEQKIIDEFNMFLNEIK